MDPILKSLISKAAKGTGRLATNAAINTGRKARTAVFGKPGTWNPKSIARRFVHGAFGNTFDDPKGFYDKSGNRFDSYEDRERTEHLRSKGQKLGGGSQGGLRQQDVKSITDAIIYSTTQILSNVSRLATSVNDGFENISEEFARGAERQNERLERIGAALGNLNLRPQQQTGTTVQTEKPSILPTATSGLLGLAGGLGGGLLANHLLNKDKTADQTSQVKPEVKAETPKNETEHGLRSEEQARQPIQTQYIRAKDITFSSDKLVFAVDKISGLEGFLGGEEGDGEGHGQIKKQGQGYGSGISGYDENGNPIDTQGNSFKGPFGTGGGGGFGKRGSSSGGNDKNSGPGNQDEQTKAQINQLKTQEDEARKSGEFEKAEQLHQKADDLQSGKTKPTTPVVEGLRKQADEARAGGEYEKAAKLEAQAEDRAVGKPVPAAATEGGSPYLANERSKLMEEIEKDPQLKKEVIAMGYGENDKNPMGPIASLIDRARAEGHTIKQALRGKFYAGWQDGRIQENAAHLSDAKIKAGEAALGQLKGGADPLEGRTDQGMWTDPGHRDMHAPGAAPGTQINELGRTHKLKNINGEWYSIKQGTEKFYEEDRRKKEGYDAAHPQDGGKLNLPEHLSTDDLMRHLTGSRPEKEGVRDLKTEDVVKRVGEGSLVGKDTKETNPNNPAAPSGQSYQGKGPKPLDYSDFRGEADSRLSESVIEGAKRVFGDPNDPNTRYIATVGPGGGMGFGRGYGYHGAHRAIDMQIYDREKQQYVGGHGSDIMKNAFNNPATFNIYDAMARGRYDYLKEKYGEAVARQASSGTRFGSTKQGGGSDEMHQSMGEGGSLGPLSGPASGRLLTPHGYMDVNNWIKSSGQEPLGEGYKDAFKVPTRPPTELEKQLGQAPSEEAKKKILDQIKANQDTSLPTAVKPATAPVNSGNWQKEAQDKIDAIKNTKTSLTPDMPPLPSTPMQPRNDALKPFPDDKGKEGYTIENGIFKSGGGPYSSTDYDEAVKKQFSGDDKSSSDVDNLSPASTSAPPPSDPPDQPSGDQSRKESDSMASEPPASKGGESDKVDMPSTVHADDSQHNNVEGLGRTPVTGSHSEDNKAGN